MSGVLGGVAFGLGGGIVIALMALIGVWWERKVSGRIHWRYGPQEAGPFGLIQTLADTVKLLLKEDIAPTYADLRVFRVAPLIVFAPIAMSLVVIPLANGWAPLDTSIGVLFFLAVPGLSVLGVLAAGWASHNTYATLGALRGAAQMVSYEVPRSLSVLALVLLAGTMRPVELMESWSWWWLLVTFPGFLVYVISSIAELNRGPFDLPEAESELVAGYFADYSGIRWAIFMMAEYGGMLSASLFGAVAFWGGTNGVPGALGVAIILAKAFVFVTLFMWIRWTFPRMRQDQLMEYAWKVLTPMALVQLLIVGVVIGVSA